MQSRRADIKKAIAQYAKAYKRLEAIQRKERDLSDCLIPIGDQKTGAIGEFWAVLCMRHNYPDATVSLNPNHNAPYDILVKRQKMKPIKVQVKTIGPFSKTKVMSGIKKGHDQLHVVELDESFGLGPIPEYRIQCQGKARSFLRSKIMRRYQQDPGHERRRQP